MARRLSSYFFPLLVLVPLSGGALVGCGGQSRICSDDPSDPLLSRCPDALGGSNENASGGGGYDGSGGSSGGGGYDGSGGSSGGGGYDGSGGSSGGGGYDGSGGSSGGGGYDGSGGYLNYNNYELDDYGSPYVLGTPCPVTASPANPRPSIVSCGLVRSFDEHSYPYAVDFEVLAMIGEKIYAPVCQGAGYVVTVGQDWNHDGRLSLREVSNQNLHCSIESGGSYSLYLTTQTQIEEAAGITYVTGDVVVTGADIYDLSPLGSLHSLSGALVIENTSLKTLDGLQQLAGTGYTIIISSNPNLYSLAGLNLSETNSSYDNGPYLTIVANPALLSLSGLEGVSSAVDLVISNNDAITDLKGLENITRLSGNLTITENSQLMNLRALAALQSVAGAADIIDNASLPECEAMWWSNSTERTIAGGTTSSGNNGAGSCY